jgi:phosphoenolpyruvate phosphomutase
MGNLTGNIPKCMIPLISGETIISRQLYQLVKCGIKEAIITTGAYDKAIQEYCFSLNLPLRFEFVFNNLYDKTNYIYSMYLAKDIINSDILLLHGDIVFEDNVLYKLSATKQSSMIISKSAPLVAKDFKAVIADERIIKIGTEFFDNAFMAQPFYKINFSGWKIWKNNIVKSCEAGRTDIYAEVAFNEQPFSLFPLDVGELLCSEIDTAEDLETVKKVLGSI